MRGCPEAGRGGGRHSLADVLSREDDAAGLAFEAADMPLLVQRQERLAVLDLLLAPGTVCKDKRTPLSRTSRAPRPLPSSPARGSRTPPTPHHPPTALRKSVVSWQLPPWPWHLSRALPGKRKGHRSPRGLGAREKDILGFLQKVLCHPDCYSSKTRWSLPCFRSALKQGATQAALRDLGDLLHQHHLGASRCVHLRPAQTY